MSVKFYNIQKTVGAGNACEWAQDIVRSNIQNKVYSAVKLERDLLRFPVVFGQLDRLKIDKNKVYIDYHFASNVRTFSFEFGFDELSFELGLMESLWDTTFYERINENGVSEFYARHILNDEGQRMFPEINPVTERIFVKDNIVESEKVDKIPKRSFKVNKDKMPKLSKYSSYNILTNFLDSYFASRITIRGRYSNGKIILPALPKIFKPSDVFVTFIEEHEKLPPSSGNTE